jgi:MFS family permease
LPPVERSTRHVKRVYLSLMLFNTMAASLIWGINTLFLLDAGLSRTEAFAANAFFTAGQVLFEVPTGVVADTVGRRASYLTGAVTLSLSTALYLLAWQLRAPFWAWAVTSIFLGLGFTFFSGATEAWLVDALSATGYQGKLDPVLAKGEIVEGVAMLTGSVAGGLLAQVGNLGVPYMLRAAALLITFVVAYRCMWDWGFTPTRGKKPLREMRSILSMSIDHGFRRRPVRWVMLTAPFTLGVGIYGFYAMQPYLLELYGDDGAYAVAGLAAALMAGAQIVGGMLVPHMGKVFRRRTSILLGSTVISVAMLACLAVVPSFWLAIVVFAVWGLVWAASFPVRAAYINSLIPSQQRATVLSFDNLLASSGGVVLQPALGRVADSSSYALSYAVSAGVQALALPFALLARREGSPADAIEEEAADEQAAQSPGGPSE